MNNLVLAKKNNSFLLEKREEYAKILYLFLEKLLDIYDVKQEKNLIILSYLIQFLSLEKKEDREFLLFPDIAALIHALYKQEKDTKRREDYLKKLIIELYFFLSGKNKKLPDYSCSLKNVYIAHRGQLIQGKVEFASVDSQIYINNQALKNLHFSHISNIPGHNIPLTIHDHNPFKIINIHPDQKGDNITLEPFTEQKWLEIFKQSLDMCKDADKEIYEEIRFLIKKFVAYGYHGKKHASGSYRECIGTLYLSFPEDPFQLLEAIIHEASHNKLNIVAHFYPLIKNDFQELYYSPYRPDIRHLWGVLLGVHAFVTTIYVLMNYVIKKNIQTPLHKKILLYHFKNEIGLQVLKKYGKFDTVGASLMNEIIHVHSLNKKALKSFDTVLITSAKKDAVKHLKERIDVYSDIKY